MSFPMLSSLRPILSLCLLFWFAIGARAAEVEGRYASIVVDAESLEILHARQIDELRYPASLTKVMTMLMVFDALEAGEIALDTQLPVSPTAARTPPSDIGLEAGTTVGVADLLRALAVKSANDAAVVVAEALSGDVESFAAAMTERARTLGMSRTEFRTPNGLPHPEQVTTARDIAKLASAVLRTYPEHYHWFGQKTFRFGGATYRNTNGLLHSHDDVDGFKTGFTNASGYNLLVSAERKATDGTARRVIAVVLGGATGRARNAHMSDLLEQSFASLGLSSASERPTSEAQEKADAVERVADAASATNAPSTISVLSLRRSDGRIRRVSTAPDLTPTLRQAVARMGGRDWAVRVGRFADSPTASAQLDALLGLHPALEPANAAVRPMRDSFEARFTGLSFEDAHAACATLSGLAAGCGLIAPSRG